MKWMSATSGMSRKPAASKPARMSFSACASLTPGAVMRTIWQPTSASLIDCATVAATSWVGVVHMLCTATGALPPTGTRPTMTWRESRRA